MIITFIHKQCLPVCSLCASCPIHNYSDTVSLTCLVLVTSIFIHTVECSRYVSPVIVVPFTRSMPLGIYLSVSLELPTQNLFGHVSLRSISSYPHNISLGMYLRYIGSYPHNISLGNYSHSISLGMYLSLYRQLPTQHLFGHVSFRYIGNCAHTHTHTFCFYPHSFLVLSINVNTKCVHRILALRLFRRFSPFQYNSLRVL